MILWFFNKKMSLQVKILKLILLMIIEKDYFGYSINLFFVVVAVLSE